MNKFATAYINTFHGAFEVYGDPPFESQREAEEWINKKVATSLTGLNRGDIKLWEVVEIRKRDV